MFKNLLNTLTTKYNFVISETNEMKNITRNDNETVSDNSIDFQNNSLFLKDSSQKINIELSKMPWAEPILSFIIPIPGIILGANLLRKSISPEEKLAYVICLTLGFVRTFIILL